MASVIRSVRPALRLARRAIAPSSVRNYAAETKEHKDMEFTFAAANQVYYDAADVRQVDVPSFSGAFGILPKHVPILAVLSPGVVTVFEKDGSSKKIFVSSGTVCVNDDSSVQILAEEAHPVEHLDLAAARESLSKAQSELASATGEEKEKAAIAVEVAEAIVKAAE